VRDRVVHEVIQDVPSGYGERSTVLLNGMYDTFGDKRALFLRALEMYVTESVQSISAELEKPGSALSAVRNALVTYAERKDLSSAEGCIWGLMQSVSSVSGMPT